MVDLKQTRGYTVDNRGGSDTCRSNCFSTELTSRANFKEDLSLKAEPKNNCYLIQHLSEPSTDCDVQKEKKRAEEKTTFLNTS